MHTSNNCLSGTDQHLAEAAHSTDCGRLSGCGGSCASDQSGLLGLLRYLHDLALQVFTESTHIVAIRTSGNVYAWEAVEELNIKPRFMKDLLTDQPFTRKDIIHIQDPMNLEASVKHCCCQHASGRH